jgi:hypothetical protein
MEHSLTKLGPHGVISANLEVAKSDTLQSWPLTSTTPGAGSWTKGVNEGPLALGVDLGTFSLSSSGELTSTAGYIPKPSIYIAVSGMISVRSSAVRRPLTLA